MNKRIAFGGISIIAALALMAGATYAFFSDSATSTGNTFATGTLDLRLDDNNESTPASTITSSIGVGSSAPLVPGGTVSGFISMHNAGSITIEEVNLGATQTGTSTPDLATMLNKTSALIGDDLTCTTNQVDVTASLPATLAGLNSTTVDLPSSSIAAGATKYLCLTYTLDPTTDDTFQGKSITETFTFIGHQSAASQ
jgi:spore coat-associated protein N